MNYLAHLLLAERRGLCPAGTLMGDGLRGPVDALGSAGLRRAVWHHRKLDSFTDTHPAFRRARRRLDPGYRHFRGVLVDIFFDHYLARHWRRFHDEPLAVFCERTYRRLLATSAFPELRGRVERMARIDLLGSYLTLEGIDRALRGLSRRVQRANHLHRGGHELRAHYQGLEGDFLDFFPQAVAYGDSLGVESTG
ncbi:MAG: acyl carrier protein phosphodiesterase [Acidobacteriota bacterium]|nr:acyl carrier protein phosphodiesterase [Acidobacteriota bacterium]MDQ7087014.1 acyl carrier protein phosphodiesterase [Acidobacteriota bacterium]